MPYFITVLVLVVIGVGFTLFNQKDQAADTTTSTAQTETVSVNEVSSTLTPSLPPDVPTEAVPETPTTPTSQPVPTTPSTPPANPAQSANPTPQKPTAPAAVAPSTYTDGTYNSRTNYRTPDGTYEMTVSLTIKQDAVTASTITFDTKGAQSGYSKRFESAYQSLVIGKDLENISLSRVGGASLTTKAFNSVIESIRAQAS